MQRKNARYSVASMKADPGYIVPQGRFQFRGYLRYKIPIDFKTCSFFSGKLVDLTITNMMNAFSPITSSVLGYFIFGQVISPAQILGIVIIIGAVFILNKTSPPEET